MPELPDVADVNGWAALGAAAAVWAAGVYPAARLLIPRACAVTKAKTSPVAGHGRRVAIATRTAITGGLLWPLAVPSYYATRAWFRFRNRIAELADLELSQPAITDLRKEDHHGSR